MRGKCLNRRDWRTVLRKAGFVLWGKLKIILCVSIWQAWTKGSKGMVLQCDYHQRQEEGSLCWAQERIKNLQQSRECYQSKMTQGCVWLCVFRERVMELESSKKAKRGTTRNVPVAESGHWSQIANGSRIWMWAKDLLQKKKKYCI